MIVFRLIFRVLPAFFSSSLSARSRITFGLVCMLLSVMSASIMLGMVPNPKPTQLRGRARLCEALALCSTDYIARGDFNRLEAVLRAIVDRNEDLLSAGIRRHSGELISEVGMHSDAWIQSEGNKSLPNQVLVPIGSGNMQWGTVELRFTSLDQDWLTWALKGNGRMVYFITSACYLLFYYYLGKMLQALDPSRSVPKRVRAALDSLAEGLLVIDSSDRIVLANQSFASWIGKDAEKLVGQDTATVGWCNEELGLVEQDTPWKMAIDQERAVASVMMGLRDSKGEIRILMANASPVLGQDGQYRGVLVSFDDVTQLEETKRNLDDAKKAAEEANQAKSDFLAQMSHEIRTPMNAILGYTDVMRRGFDESERERQDYLNTIHSSGEHLLALINDILDLSKIEAGRLELELQACSVHELISQVASVLKVKSDEKGLDLRVDFGGKLPETINADPVRLRQSIMNLAGNAIKFTESGSVTIATELLADCNESNEAMLAIHVIDTGIGISEEAQKRIFDPFSQADNSITRRFGGTGLGLSISKQLCEAMGGGVSVRSELGKGSCFTMKISLGSLEGVRMISAEEAKAVLAKQTQEKRVLQLPPCHILVADDGDSNRKLVSLVLKRAGAEVLCVENGQLAVEAAQNGSFDVILMDMQMPVMDGYTATRTLRASGYTKPIYALTANAMQGDEQKCRDAGCSGFLTKPLVIDKLLATLFHELGGQESNAQYLEAGSKERDRTGMECEVTELESKLCAEAEELVFEIADVVRCSLPMDDEEFREIAKEFCDRLEQQLELMRTTFEASDWETLAKLAHWLKGSGGTTGFDDFTEPARQLEMAAKSRNVEESRRWLETLTTMHSRIELTEA